MILAWDFDGSEVEELWCLGFRVYGLEFLDLGFNVSGLRGSSR